MVLSISIDWLSIVYCWLSIAINVIADYVLGTKYVAQKITSKHQEAQCNERHGKNQRSLHVHLDVVIRLHNKRVKSKDGLPNWRKPPAITISLTQLWRHIESV
jgi:hypothetical protein